mgnify:CR=1 FL=1
MDDIAMYFPAVLAFMGISIAFVQFVEETIYVNTFLDLAKEDYEKECGNKGEASRIGKLVVDVCDLCKRCAVWLSNFLRDSLNSLRDKFAFNKKKKSSKEIFSDYVKARSRMGLDSPSVTDLYVYRIKFSTSFISLVVVALGVFYLFIQKGQVFYQEGQSLSWPGFILLLAIMFAYMFGMTYFFWRKKLMRKMIMREIEAAVLMSKNNNDERD